MTGRLVRGALAAEFVLDARLAADSAPIGRLPLSEVRWVRDARYPWALLVPARPGVVELFDLSPEDRRALIEESALLARLLGRLVSAHKTNVATIGNVVPQLHVHVVARFRDDDAWPRPVWGLHPAKPYDDDVLRARIEALRTALAREPGAGFVASG